jgi:parallel beta-helix repeat protein
MKRLTINLGVSLVLGLGLALALLWLLGGGGAAVSVNAAHPLAVQAGPQTGFQSSLSNGTTITRYVAITGTDTATCAAPISACRTIQYAVDVASAGDVIKVATGVYTGVQSRAAPAGYPTVATVDQVVYVSKTVTIRGGYTTTNGFADPPNPETYPTTLNAQNQGRVLFIAGDIDPALEGLRITRGNATGQGGIWGSEFSHFEAGGGIYVLGATATISNNEIYNNTAGTTNGSGGGMCLRSSDATLVRNTITDNRATNWFGGGIYLLYSPITLIENDISDNSARWGGAVFLELSPATVTNNTFSDNSITQGGGALNVHTSDATLSGNTVSNNTAVQAGAIRVVQCAATLNDNVIFGNSSTGYGGALHLWEAHNTTLSGNAIFDNQTNGDGGAIEFWDSDDVTLDGNTILTNTAGDDGGALHLLDSSNVNLLNNVIADNHAGGDGSGLYLESSIPHLEHNTIASNHGGGGQGIYVASFSVVDLSNTALVSHSVGIVVDSANSASLNATLWGTGTWSNETDWSGDGTIVTGSVNLWGYPDFVAPDEGDYHIGLDSAAIDAGVNVGVNVDIDGERRPSGAGYDIGADEFYFKVYLPLVIRLSTVH